MALSKPVSNYVLVFDTETSGLFPKDKNMSLEDMPYITQLSWVIYDTTTMNIVESFNSYIKIPESVCLSDEVIAITGITNDICNEKGKDIVDCLSRFYNAYEQCGTIVAHNIEFDEKCILIEIERNRERIICTNTDCLSLFNMVHEQFRDIKRYCTMKNGMKECNLYMIDKTTMLPDKKTAKRKYPKLSELYCKLFDTIIPPANLHNSMIDVLVCLQCYMRMKYGVDKRNDIVLEEEP